MKTNAKAQVWKGYDYDQLIYLQAVNLVRRQSLKERILSIAGSIRHPFKRDAQGQIPGIGIGRQVLGLVLKNVDKVDYIILGVSIIKRLRHLFKKSR